MAFSTSMVAAASSDVCTNMANVEPVEGGGKNMLKKRILILSFQSSPGGSGPSTASLVLIFKMTDCKSLSSCNKCSSSL